MTSSLESIDFQDLNDKALDAIRGHVGGCLDCRSRYAALHAEVTLGERRFLPLQVNS